MAMEGKTDLGAESLMLEAQKAILEEQHQLLDVNYANQGSQNEGDSACEKGLTGPGAKYFSKDFDALWRFRWVRTKVNRWLRE